jgi:hypothetical protein
MPGQVGMGGEEDNIYGQTSCQRSVHPRSVFYQCPIDCTWALKSLVCNVGYTT